MTFDEILDAELDGLRRYAQVLTGDRQEAHDTLAEALIKVQSHWRRIEVLDRPLQYVRRVVTNQFLQERRSWSARMFRSMNPGSLPQPAPLGESEVRRVDDRSELHTLLASLPRQQRAAIVLRHYLDLQARPSDLQFAARLRTYDAPPPRAARFAGHQVTNFDNRDWAIPMSASTGSCLSYLGPNRSWVTAVVATCCTGPTQEWADVDLNVSDCMERVN